ncbi:hypothetical protein FGG52_gp32 [Mycobacterium phage Backyardigan]|uniref:Uncharacterized protein n=1 Tax=Mycobacterium phage Backyardigan TaxID=2902881 RepID=G1BL05_9CAUD|nr:hypothetical protein WILE_32 [Mycobacterium phage Wile]YP_009635445.1 hypothetical protein FGG52_gp32 [Mycobacterium phage Backyardigan]AOT27540.1 hypothetical protein SEA_BADGER_32 [Mycobacterium phage Badger]ASZ73665.1 membrane protein [Mycobacterium phage Morpher26]AZS11644.1 hypothetical protein SEA_CICI_32 [Mycobacterium phage Cici]QAY06941.1 hypothetical protein SEA_DATWAY_32 [Mycobacterium phage Datway]QCW22682.1 hypothetical protein SEA_XENA_32 [Mycobacterium phage Xena]QFP95699.1
MSNPVPYPYPVPSKRKPAPNPLFLVLAILSAVPTAFFVLAFLLSPTMLWVLAAGWCGMWTAVWGLMANRYR